MEKTALEFYEEYDEKRNKKQRIEFVGIAISFVVCCCWLLMNIFTIKNGWVEYLNLRLSLPVLVLALIVIGYTVYFIERKYGISGEIDNAAVEALLRYQPQNQEKLLELLYKHNQKGTLNVEDYVKYFDEELELKKKSDFIENLKRRSAAQ